MLYTQAENSSTDDTDTPDNTPPNPNDVGRAKLRSIRLAKLKGYSDGEIAEALDQCRSAVSGYVRKYDLARPPEPMEYEQLILEESFDELSTYREACFKTTDWSALTLGLTRLVREMRNIRTHRAQALADEARAAEEAALKAAEEAENEEVEMKHFVCIYTGKPFSLPASWNREYYKGHLVSTAEAERLRMAEATSGDVDLEDVFYAPP